MRVNLTCPVCGAAFERLACQVTGRWGTYCSRPCMYQARRERNRLPAVVDGAVARIPLITRDGSIKAYALVDAADAEFVSQWKWYLNSQGYVVRSAWIDGKPWSLALHRALLGFTPGDGREGDHISMDKLDNRRSNLRPATQPENAQNKPSIPGSSSKYRGVHWNKRLQKWQVGFTAQGKRYHFGLFLDEDEAGRVARDARQHLMPFATN